MLVSEGFSRVEYAYMLDKRKARWKTIGNQKKNLY